MPKHHHAGNIPNLRSLQGIPSKDSFSRLKMQLLELLNNIY